MERLYEKDLLLQLKNGSSEAFERLFYEHSGKLYNFILKFSSRNKYLAEEIVQRTFVKLWETHSLINPEKNFNSYLCTIAKNMLINEYEHRTLEYIYKEYILKNDSANDNVTEEEVNKNLLEEYINSLIEKLPPARKQIFILKKKEMWTNRDIAEHLQISESTVENQLSKAISFMREQLTKYYDYLLSLIAFIFINQAK
jgi:RNA polymerase sigma-70 factor, Bacteroides expansion family 1